ncbi:class I adenylate-forming enzyme family protein [Streptomyces noursei]|uniref:class I adenylate-forming enzyme family protein n=1 Tax=Streptomyces noursei TaxID=1971 RepID=UPI00167603C4|nr:class I adenylate-forming enzyme family protein [Streptomyces noursei]MCZ1020746.1 class I adenylate-forming enzyme family protein [Streptomyces noursei]GGX28532.1 putative fatty-acid-CoA ligase FadD [Streptomyces noursei]
MSSRMSGQRGGLPPFLTTYAPTRGAQRILPRFLGGRPLATGRIGEAWHVAAQRNPSQLLIADRPPDIDPQGPAVRTLTQWASLVDETTAWLHALGVRAWDRVAVLKANHFDLLVISSAVARIGAIPAPLSGTYGPPVDGDPVSHTLLRRLERPFLVTDRAHLDGCGLDPAALAALTRRTVCVDDTGGRLDVVDLASLRGGAVPTARLRAPDEPMWVTHTSGTTGVPKLVMHSATSAHAMDLVEAERWPLWMGQRDTWAFCDPFWHERTMAFQLSLATIGLRMIMLSDARSPAVRRLLIEHRPTVVEAMPNMFLSWEDLARDPDRPFGNVRLFLNSFDAIHTRTMRTLLDASDRRLPLWIQAWSQSECGPIALRPYTRRSVRHRGKRPPVNQSLGRPVPGYGKIRAVDPETGRPVRRGRVGLIEFSQPGRCLAYVGEQDRHELKRNGDWWNTGDLGVINQFGMVRLVDREVDRIAGGSAIELEDVLLDRLPQLTEIVILPAVRRRPLPVYSTVGDRPLDPGEWQRAVRDLPDLAEPVRIAWEEFPRTGTWKIARGRLRERLMPGARPVGTGRWT